MLMRLLTLRLSRALLAAGSSPQATIEWIKDKQVMPRVGESFSEDGFITTSFLTFLPTMDDNGKLLSCRATNAQFPNVALEDGFVMDVHCACRGVRERESDCVSAKTLLFILDAPFLSLAMGTNSPSVDIVEGSNITIYMECQIQASTTLAFERSNTRTRGTQRSTR